MRKLVLIPICLALTGCGVFKEDRRDIPIAPPRLDFKETEQIQKAAKINHEIAKWIKENGAKPNSEQTIVLEDGTRVILKYLGDPYEDVDALNMKESKKNVKRAEEIAEDYRKDLAKHGDKLNDQREDIIHDTNQKWAWGRIFGFGIGTWLIAIIGVPVLCAFFPVIIPVVSLVFQLFKTGIGAMATIAKFGVSGLKNVVSAVETFREKHKGTEIGEAFDAHMKQELDQKDKNNLDELKNKLKI